VTKRRLVDTILIVRHLVQDHEKQARIAGKLSEDSPMSACKLDNGGASGAAANVGLFRRRNNQYPLCDQEEPAVGFGEIGVRSPCEIRTGKHAAGSRSPETGASPFPCFFRAWCTATLPFCHFLVILLDIGRSRP